VNTADPVMNFPQVGTTLKRLFQDRELGPDQIILAINNGLKNDFVMNSGYSLSVMLSANVLNGLLNSRGPPSSGRGNHDTTDLSGRKSLGAMLGGGAG